MAEEGVPHSTSAEMEIHPLENIVILEEIFSHCPATLETLKTLRLVSKSWKEACAPRWMSLAVPIVITQEEDKQQDNDDQGNGSTTLEKYLQEYKNEKSVRFPQRRMTLEGWIFENDHFEPAKDDVVTDLGHFDLVDDDVRPRRSITGGIYFSIENDHLTFEEEDALTVPTKLSTLNRDFWKSSYQNVTTLELNGCTLLCHINLFPESFLRAFPNLRRLNLISCIIPSYETIGKYLGFLESKIFNKRRNVMHQTLERNKHVVENHVRHSLRLPSHEKLTSLRVENMESSIPVTVLMIMFPNLESFTMRKTPNGDSVIGAIGHSAVVQTLKRLDIMQASNGTFKEEETTLFQSSMTKFVTLEELSFECGLKRNFGVLQQTLHSQSGTLKKLKLYRNPFAAAYRNFPCFVVMANLTELHLWGNLSENLNFLKFTPKLQVLKWNVNCYDESDHGAWINKYICSNKCKEHLLFPYQILENTTELDNEFRLEDMRSFEMSWGPVTDEFWMLLGGWMPNLKELKGTVLNDVEFEFIADQWPGMEHLELAHKSKVSAFGILNVLTTRKLLHKLKSFTWKWCPCIITIADAKVQSQEMFAENELRKLAGRNVTLPWRRWSTVHQQECEIWNKDTCLQALFEKVLTSI